MARVKYPLTSDAKIAACELSTAWNENRVDQLMSVHLKDDDEVSFARLSSIGLLAEFSLPQAGVLVELQKYGLIDLRLVHSSNGYIKQIEVTLLQELRNAVASDFEVSDYFLTFNAVGTIVSGDLVVHPGGNFQSGASTSGDVNLTIDQVIEKVESILGTEFLENQPALAEAIKSVKQPDQGNFQNRMGRVISELGRCLEHTANFAGVLAAIQFISGVLR